MEKSLSIEEFYQSKLNCIPDNLKKEIGHFNVSRLSEFAGTPARPVPYNAIDCRADLSVSACAAETHQLEHFRNFVFARIRGIAAFHQLLSEKFQSDTQEFQE